MAYGICKICGCRDNDPCWHPVHGCCWWVDETHELCSHCADKVIADDPLTQQRINSNGIDPFPGIERKDLAELGCPFPDEDGEACCECSKWSPLFGCDLGIGK